MLAKQPRCEVYVLPQSDRTGEKAMKCNAMALACEDCGDSAGCEEHALRCPRCGKRVCNCCADAHRCVAKAVGKAKSTRDV